MNLELGVEVKYMNINELPSKLLDKIHVESNTGCWLWGGRLHNGYAAFDVSGPWLKAIGKQKSLQVRAHRMLYEMYIGGIDGELDHICHTKSCVNPMHLRAVGHASHMQRHHALAEPRTQCKFGHPYLGDTFYWIKGSKGWERRCKICYKERLREWRVDNPERYRLSNARNNAKRKP